MALFVFVLSIAVMVLWSRMRSQRDEFRSDLRNFEAQIFDRIRLMETRIRELELDRVLTRPAPPSYPEEAPLPSAEQPRPEPEYSPATAAAPEPQLQELLIVATFIAPTESLVISPAFEAQENRHASAFQAPPEAALPPPLPPVDLPTPPPNRVGASLEERVGTNWLNKIGIAIVVTGIAFFLAHQLKTMGPVGKVLTGFAIGFALLASGVWLERQPTYRIFARAGIGGGWALIFFTVYAMHHLDAARILASPVVDLIFMLLAAAGMVAHSLRYRSQAVTGLAFFLGYLTVLTSHMETNQGTVVFSLLASAILAIGLVVVTTVRHWARLELAGLIAVLVNHFVWLSLVLSPGGGATRFAFFWPSTILILFQWAIFRSAYLLRKPLNIEEDRVSSLSAIVNAGGVLGLLKYQSAHPEWTFWALLAMGLIELSLGWWARSRRRSAFIVLSTIATVLLVTAVPYHFHGVNWPTLWLAEAHVLVLCGLRLGEPLFRRLGLLAGFGASLVLAIGDVAPLIASRIEGSDTNQHLSLTIALALASVLFWAHGELYPRRWPQIAGGDLESLALSITSWLGLAAAATALWVALPVAWVAFGWMVLALLLGLVADCVNANNLALQSDVLAGSAVIGLFGWDILIDPVKTFWLPTMLTIAALYAGMRRRTVLDGLGPYVAPGYSWVASFLLMIWMWRIVPFDWLALGSAALAAALYALGIWKHVRFLRWQAFVAALQAFLVAQILMTRQVSLEGGAWGWFAVSKAQSLSALAVMTLGYALQEFSRNLQQVAVAEEPPARYQREETFFGRVAAAAATVVAVEWLYRVVPAESTRGAGSAALVAWAVLAVLLLAIAYLLRRVTFSVHAIALAVWVFLFGTSVAIDVVNFSIEIPWIRGILFRSAVASALLVAGLIFAFRLRMLWKSASLSKNVVWIVRAVAYPEQWFFFAAYGLMIAAFACQLRMGNITIAWSLLGLGAFVFALISKERSFRLGGLALLLLSVVKILLMDVWALAPADRYITLIVLGCALLLVSFLYTRFPKAFRRYM